MDVWVRANIFSALGRMPAGKTEWPVQATPLAPNRAFEGELVRLNNRSRSKKVRVVLLRAVGTDS